MLRDITYVGVAATGSVEIGPGGPPSVTLTLLAAGPSAYWTLVHVDLGPYGHPSREPANVVASERTRSIDALNTP
jgi:hypothetical protein